MTSLIDLGTNTVLMVTGDVDTSGKLAVAGDEHKIGRLGKGVDATGTIGRETFDRIAAIFGRYREISESYGAERVLAYGTSALRDASNRDAFIAAMRVRTGIDLRLLSGDDEARYTWHGALSGLDLGPGSVAVLDIGGGSTEVAVGHDREFVGGRSVDVGAVRLTERFFGDGLPPRSDRIEAARTLAREHLLRIDRLPADSTLVGVAGTVTTLGAMRLGLRTFDPDAVHGMSLSADFIHDVAEGLLERTVREIAEMPGVVAGRADILPAGALILSEFVTMFDLSEIVVSVRGLRYGLLMRELGLID